MAMILTAQSDTSFSPDNAKTSAYAASLVAKAGAGVVYGISGYNSGPAQFLQLHDAAALPTDAVAPTEVIAIPTASNFSIDFGVYGKKFILGLVICNSSTGPAKTIGAADLFITARYK